MPSRGGKYSLGVALRFLSYWLEAQYLVGKRCSKAINPYQIKIIGFMYIRSTMKVERFTIH